MFAQINHMAMISHQYPLLERFYRSIFKLHTSERANHDAEASAVVGDGYVGLNILPRRDGYMGGIDHFGMVVESLAEVQKRMKNHPGASMVKRPSTRPFAAWSANDPFGNGGIGAWEIGVRKSTFDVDAALGGSGTRSGGSSTTYGIKWIPNHKVRFILNAISTDYGTTQEDAYILRTQLDF